MRVKAAFVVGGAIGYVLGTRAGREQFDKIRSSARDLWEHPRVQETVSDVEHRASGFVRDVAPELKEKVSGAVRQATGAVRSATGGDAAGDEPHAGASWETTNNGSTHSI